MTTIKDIAAVVGVAHSTVSRVLNEDPSLRVSAETRASIRQAAQDLGYTPNFAARALRESRSRIIAIAMHDLTNPVYGEILAGAQQAADERGYAVLIGDVMALARGKAALSAMIRSRSIDGLVLQPVGVEEDDLLWRTAATQVPTVLLQGQSNPACGVVRLQDREAGRLATDHLLSLGHTRIGLLTTAGGAAFTAGRVQGWREAMSAAGAACGDSLVETAGSDANSGRAAMQALLQREPDITGVVVSNAIAALGALAAAAAAGRRIPEDLSVIALHDVALALHAHPALTTVKLPLEQLGRKAIEMIIDGSTLLRGGVVMADDPAPLLIVRESTGPARK